MALDRRTLLFTVIALALLTLLAAPLQPPVWGPSVPAAEAAPAAQPAPPGA